MPDKLADPAKAEAKPAAPEPKAAEAKAEAPKAAESALVPKAAEAKAESAKPAAEVKVEPKAEPKPAPKAKAKAGSSRFISNGEYHGNPDAIGQAVMGNTLNGLAWSHVVRGDDGYTVEGWAEKPEK